MWFSEEKKVGIWPQSGKWAIPIFYQIFQTFSMELWCRVRPVRRNPHFSENQVWRLPLCLKTDVDEEEMVKGPRQGRHWSSAKLKPRCVHVRFFLTIVCFILTSSEFHSHQQCAFEEKTIFSLSLSSSGSREILCAVRNIGWCWWLGSKSDIFYFVFTLFAL